MKGKAECNQQFLGGFFCRKLHFFKSETKEVAYLKKVQLGTALKIFFFSRLLKDGLKSN